jgi:hypothetical protein
MHSAVASERELAAVEYTVSAAKRPAGYVRAMDLGADRRHVR